MISFAIGIAGLLGAVCVLAAVAYKWMEKERCDRENRDRSRDTLTALISSQPRQKEFEFVQGEIIAIGKLVNR
jgi:hypothetical protein